MDLPGDAVLRWIGIVFRGKGAEQPVPDDQGAAVVAVNVFRIAAMVSISFGS